MTQIDEFESLFNSAAKPVFQLEPQTFRKVLLIFDDSASAGSAYETQVRQLLTALSGVEKDVECEVLENSQFESVANLLEQVRDIGPDIICTYRNLRIPATDYPYSLGVYVDVLTQATSIPVLLFPRPEQVELESIEFDNPKKVVAVTDHLAGDRHLVFHGSGVYRATRNTGIGARRRRAKHLSDISGRFRAFRISTQISRGKSSWNSCSRSREITSQVASQGSARQRFRFP